MDSGFQVQSTLDNSNLQGKLKKFELSRAKLYRKRSRGFELSVLSVERGLEIPTVSGFRITKPHFLT